MIESTELESLEHTKNLLLKWKNDRNIQELKEFYNTKSFSGILGVERREMSHSNFIAWILNDKESHNLGQFAIKQLFDMLLEYGENKIKNSLDKYNQLNEQNLQFDNLYKALMLNTYTIENLTIDVEKVLDGGRIDIVVSMNIKSKKDDTELPEKVNIIIENKVDSAEHSSQTTTYYNYYTEDAKYKHCLNLFVFLLPVPTSKLFESLAECKQFININYQLLADNIFERALNHDIANRVKFMITEYLLSLRKPSKENKGQTMATGKLEKELLKDFWETHGELLGTAFGVLADEAEDEESKENFNNMKNNALKETVRDTTKYNFNGQEKLGKSKLALEIVKKYAIDNQNKSSEDLINIFNNIKTSMILLEQDAIDKDRNSKYKSWFLEYPIKLADGITIIVNSRIWDSIAINILIEKSGYKNDIEEVN